MAMMRITDTGGGSSKKTSSKTTTGNTRSSYSSGGGTSSNKSSSSNSNNSNKSNNSSSGLLNTAINNAKSYNKLISGSGSSGKATTNNTSANNSISKALKTVVNNVNSYNKLKSGANTIDTDSSNKLVNSRLKDNGDGTYGYRRNRHIADDVNVAPIVAKPLGSDDTDDDKPTYYDNGGDGSSVDTSSYYDDLMAAFMEMNSANREAALEAILQNLDAVKGTYKQQIQDVNDEYDKLVNENEVKKDRARRVIRENQANRGQLDSGMGRQEMLDMNIGYDNITTNLKAAREKAVNEIYNLITQAEAEANTNKANVNNSYQNALLEWKLANQ